MTDTVTQSIARRTMTGTCPECGIKRELIRVTREIGDGPVPTVRTALICRRCWERNTKAETGNT